MPCVFMIGENGVPLEVAGGYIPPSELAEKFNKALQASCSIGIASIFDDKVLCKTVIK